MRTTLDLDNQLYKEAKHFAAEHQLTLTAVMEDGLRALFQQKQALKTSGKD
jgi:predicted DNA-binding ribbon-helix-helix protein